MAPDREPSGRLGLLYDAIARVNTQAHALQAGLEDDAPVSDMAVQAAALQRAAAQVQSALDQIAIALDGLAD